MKIAMLFPGYGSQYIGMGKELYDHSRIVQEYFEEASSCLNLNVTKLIFASSDLDLSLLSNALVSQFIISTAWWAYLKQEGIVPTIVAGFNLGGYAALFAAGGISFPDGLYLLNKYAFLYEETIISLNTVQIVRVKGIDEKTLEKYCKEVPKEENVAIAMVISADEYIISGTYKGIEMVKDKIGKVVSLIELPHEVGLHSSVLNSLADSFAVYLEKVDFKDLTTPVINSTSNITITAIPQAKEMLLNLVNKKIDWYGTMQFFADVDMMVQVGPGTDLADLCKQAYPNKKVKAVNTLADVDEIKKYYKKYKTEG